MLVFSGPIFLARARRTNADPEVIYWGEQIVTISVLAIVFCAPLGGMFIMNLGPILLDNSCDSSSGSVTRAAQLPPSESKLQLTSCSSTVSMEEDDRGDHQNKH